MKVQKAALKEVSQKMVEYSQSLDNANLRYHNNQDPRLIQGMELAIKNAQDSLQSVYGEFAELFPKSAVSVFLSGAKSQQFAESFQKAMNSANVVTLDLNQLSSDLYDALLTQCKDSLHINSFEFNMIQGHVARWAENYALQMPELQFAGAVYVGDDNAKLNPGKLYEELNKYLCQVPAQYFKYLVEERAVTRAIHTKITATTVPVLLYNATPDLATKLGPILFDGKSETFVVSDNYTNQDVETLVAQYKPTKTKTTKSNNSEEQQ
jgi:hypothetical protein